MKQIPNYKEGYEASSKESDEEPDGKYKSEQRFPYSNPSRNHLKINRIIIVNQRFWVEDFRNYALFKIDPTSRVNIIKLGLLRKNSKIDCTPTREGKSGDIESLGTTWLKIRGIPHKFYVVDDDVYFGQDGILGRAFIHKCNAILFKMI